MIERQKLTSFAADKSGLSKKTQSSYNPKNLAGPVQVVQVYSNQPRAIGRNLHVSWENLPDEVPAQNFK